MSSIAILVGNNNYSSLAKLGCCIEDVSVMRELLEATGKYPTIELLLDVDAASLKDRLRSIAESHSSAKEVIFYFSGHGVYADADFFFCATDFDAKRPNETGLSNTDLHEILRSMNADLVVKIIDACNSGALLIKAEAPVFQATKQGFRNLIQIASCLDSQFSLTGDPISEFTERFRSAALRKKEGPIYYTDLMNTLRDDYIEDKSRTPFFVSQGTGREQFVDDAHRLDELRAKIAATMEQDADGPESVEPSASTLTTLELLRRAEESFATKEVAQRFIAGVFDELSREMSGGEFFKDLFDIDVAEHSDFKEVTTRSFIIRVLSQERRPDNFVTAGITKEMRKRDPFGIRSVASSFAAWVNPDDVVEHHTLDLNCTLEKVQLRITLKPRFMKLKQFVLVVTCAPSLEVCFVFEMLTQHSLRDWGEFDDDGTEVARRWYKMSWTDETGSLVAKICDKVRTTVQEAVDSTEKALSGPA